MRSTPASRRLATVLAAVALGVGFGAVPALAAPAAAPALVPASCATAPAGHAKCQALQLVNPGAAPAAAVSPADLQKAYGVTGLKSGGATVAIVDAFNDPHIEADLGDYRKHWGLPDCTTANGCFKVVGQDGTSTLPSGTDSGWATEMAIDVDAVSAVCPDCHILLVEGNTNDDGDLAKAVDSAVRLGAKFVSNSYTDHESAIPSDAETHYNHPGVVITAATGDAGQESGSNANYPATSPEVVAVGGTTLTPGGGGRGFTETAWSKAGSSCSSTFATPGFQSGISTGCAKRATADISADADPQTGITIYVNGATSQYGGTSLASPLVTGIWALAGAPNAGDNAPTYPYAHASNFNDVTSGSNGSCGTVLCNAGTGWDGPTGLGTPNGIAGLTPGGSTGTVSVTNPGDQATTVGRPVSLQLKASGGTSPYTYSATGLPAGLGLDSKSGLISGSPTAAGSNPVKATATDSAGKSGSVSFTWTVTAAGKLSVASPGNQGTAVGQPVSLQVNASGGTSPYSYSATGLPAGTAINGKSGLISGTPTTAGSNPVAVTVTDAANATATANFTWTITPAAPSGLTATFAVDNDFGTTAFTHFTITNKGTAAAAGWKLSFDIPANESLQLSNPGTVSGSTGHVVITGSGSIPAGGSLTVTNIYNFSGTFAAPANVVAGKP
jgi:hypothetical protein